MGNRIGVIFHENWQEFSPLFYKTQIAPTPIVYGEDAKIMLREALSKPSQKSKDNGLKLIEYFKRFTK
jgi:hypothetical protein